MPLCPVVSDAICRLHQLLGSFVHSGMALSRGKGWQVAMGRAAQSPPPRLPLQQGQDLQLFWVCRGVQEEADEQQLW